MGQTDSLTTIRDRVKAIIRRDLKLGDVEIADDMVFFNESSDLDSLDMLLLVTSVEREFGFKIPSQEVGREAFVSVDALSRYIHQRTAAGETAIAPTAPSPVDPLGRLPHGEPFRFVSQVTGLRTGESAEGVWRVSGEEAFFAGHFPGRPIVPGVLLGEALAQLSGLIPAQAGAAGMQGRLAHVDIRFEQSVTPPAEIILRSRLVKVLGALHQFDVSAEVGGSVAARGTLALHLAGEEGKR
jgi:3-hydroxyacyl-[acyl-carrier-protein] dehydratase